jgi:3-oxoacyl-[acyl-carrier protein] reductase
MMEVNTTAPYLLCKAALPDMVAAGWGRIINVGSIAGKLPTFHGVSYSASKAAVGGRAANSIERSRGSHSQDPLRPRRPVEDPLSPLQIGTAP